MAWDCAIPPDTRGDVLVQWCLDNDCVIHNTGDCTRHTTRHGPSAPDVTISRECRLESWTAFFSLNSDHYIILFDVVVVGDDDEPLRFPRPRAPIYACKKAKWSRFGQISNAQCNKRLKEKQSVHKRERLLTSAIRIATAASVPRGGGDTTPFLDSRIRGNRKEDLQLQTLSLQRQTGSSQKRNATTSFP
ncbi:Tbingi protein [Trypanosoma theileri]|uniref:Tbingi protein n=1 Tax=Trypanosoma theileri TaxID=67003 RepID=A0A1X0P303_9TRYP|nr:Tbingi protein [Trypanosoma theileri]ORC91265.1 Tbingi protein [Trypanosoma theileri]